MPKFLVENLTDKAAKLAIEPWADLEILKPRGRAEFEYEEPAEIEFSLTSGGACISIWSDRIRVSANGGEKIFRQPKGYRRED
jgi:hypothetical protein